MSEEHQKQYDEFLLMRDVRHKDICVNCNGLGVVWYGNTATWRGGIGGAMMTKDVCNHCWGSGNKNKTWLSHKKYWEIERENKQLKQAVSEFIKKVNITEVNKNIGILWEALEGMPEYRKLEGIGSE